MVAIVPILITTGKITNHISTTVLKPEIKNSLNPGDLIPTSVAKSKPYFNAVLPSGSCSLRASSLTSLAYSSGIFLSGQILGIIIAAIKHEMTTVK
ncbi:hypothetical protein SETU_01649 [Staphylococcus epidermidis]|nr:hypothetical protein SETU_01649 [Staphylococcus epidermidis]